MSTTAFKCPCCGAELVFSSQAQKMSCEYCGTELDVEAVSALSENEESHVDMDWGSYSETTVDAGDNVCTYSCNSCGAEIVGDKTLGATSCPYCDNPFVINEKFDGMLKPDLIIPFKVDKDKAVEQFKNFCKNRPLLPGNFMSSHKIESIQGMYVPYWLYGCETGAKFRFRGERVDSWNEGDYRVTKTDHFLLIREGNMAFDNVPVDGVEKLDNDITESVEPFSVIDAVDFNAAYLSGYLADRYNVSAEDCKGRANERIEESVEHAFMETTDTYVGVRTETKNISLNHGKIKYALMPMWILTAKYNDKLYTFAMNGQTGRFVGTLPVSMKRFWAMFFGIAAGASAVLSVLLSLAGV